MTSKLPLPAFLELFTNASMSVPDAMVIASKIYKSFNTPENLSKLTDLQLLGLGIDNKEERKRILSAINKAGIKNTSSVEKVIVKPSSADQLLSKASSRKRQRADYLNDTLPRTTIHEEALARNFDFNEILDEENLKMKSAIVNRAPVMTAWASIVAERLGFKREEALSIASAYTEMNATSKGVSLGVFNVTKCKGSELINGESQPYVDFMGRRFLYICQSGQWRALVNGEPIEPSTAFSYISRSFRQTVPHIMGAMRLVAETYSPDELNKKGFSLYVEFRPEVDGWGKRAEITCQKILKLRKFTSTSTVDNLHIHTPKINFPDELSATNEAPEPKRAKAMTLEEYEELLDEYDRAFEHNVTLDES